MKGQYYTILALIFAVLVAVFAISNAVAVDISFLYWHYKISQALVILISAAIGAITIGIIGVFGQVRYSMRIRGLNNRIKEIEKEKDELNKKVIEMQNTIIDKTDQKDDKQGKEEKSEQTM
ncbi:MAG: LapA family protein [Thermoanaerobacteraceae bacterium]